MSAEFCVVKVDPEGSGMDFSGHLGMVVKDANRCCPRCTVIFGTLVGEEGTYPDAGPFVPGELSPLNDEAKEIVTEIDAFRDARGRAFTG
jgi:hypothetical protein